MERTITFRGTIVSGARKAAFFTQLDWVQDQCLQKLGFLPYPGTVNIQVLPEGAPALLAIKEAEGIRLIPPDPQFCEGRALPAALEGLEGCIFIPPEEVNIHTPTIIEFMAPVMVKATLGLEDGDVVRVVLEV